MPTARIETLRGHISRYLPIYSFLAAYLLTVVLGNVNFAMPWGMDTVRTTGMNTEIFKQSTTFSIGYWTLLLSPFIVCPLFFIVFRRLFVKITSKFQPVSFDIGRVQYLIITAVMYAIVLHSFYDADVFHLARAGDTANTSVAARFLLLARLGFLDTMILQALLVFLTYYSLIRTLRRDGIYWTIASIFNFVLMSFLLFELNMKWPVLLFYIGTIMCVFVYTQSRPFTKAIIGGILLLIVYFVISTLVYRISYQPSTPQPHTASLGIAVPTPTTAGGTTSTDAKFARSSNARVGADMPAPPSSQTSPSTAPTPQASLPGPEPAPPAKRAPPTGAIRGIFAHAGGIFGASMHMAPLYMAQALNRMAIIYPYYYNVFTDEGNICGNLITQLTPGVKCRPSWLIYTRMFGNDGFEGRGTAPAAAHISAYADGGWPLAMLALVGLSIVLAAFSALPLQGSAIFGSLVIIGSIAGYHFSQIPAEGVVFYAQGFGWVLLGLALYWAGHLSAKWLWKMAFGNIRAAAR